MKAVLVVDMPEDYMGSVIDVKLYGKDKVVHEHYVNKLRPLPSKAEVNKDSYGIVRLTEESFAFGYNACLEQILGETE